MGDADSPVTRMLTEMRRRRIFRTAAIYIVGTWLVMQVADVVFPALNIPERAIRYVLIAALLGFPAAITFSWFYDVGADGIRRTGPAGTEELGATHSLRRSDYLILTAFASVLAFILYSAVSDVINSSQEVREARRDGPPMVAVLPFTAMGLTGDSEFFAAGMHDDLLTQLAQLHSIRVISRTSVLEYRDTVRNMRDIGNALGADAILEGGVQSAGNRIRINAQLIDARTDVHLWAKSYDRELSPSSIFEVQAEIARAITSAMQATLTKQDATMLKVIPTENMAAYRAYHRAIGMRDSDNSSLEETIQAFEEAVALDPTFTRALAELVGSLTLANFAEEEPEQVKRAEEALEKIQSIAPASTDYLIAQAYYTYYILKDFDRSLQLVTQAQDIMPSDARFPALKAWIQRRQGDFEGMAESLRKAGTLDPRNVRWTYTLVRALIVSHRYGDAETVLEKSAFQDYWVSSMRNILELREHRDLDRWVKGAITLHKEFDGDTVPDLLWQAHIANRDYEAAANLLDGMPESKHGLSGFANLGEKLSSQIITYWFLGLSEQLAEALSEARTALDPAPNSDGDFQHYRANLAMALVTAAEGNTEETVRLIRRWRRRATEDLAELAYNRLESCRVLGIAGITSAAVECIRTGLAKPSDVMPFMEPFLPYYDAMRQSPEFVDMLAELDGAANNP